MAPSYPTAAANVQAVGVLTGNLVDFFISQGADQNQFHLMGFSLGAHVVGRAGLTANGRLPKITGTIIDKNSLNVKQIRTFILF